MLNHERKLEYNARFFLEGYRSRKKFEMQGDTSACVEYLLHLRKKIRQFIFLTLTIVLKTYMTLPITIFQVEGNFSKLLIMKKKLINHARKKTGLLYSLCENITKLMLSKNMQPKNIGKKKVLGVSIIYFVVFAVFVSF